MRQLVDWGRSVLALSLFLAFFALGLSACDDSSKEKDLIVDYTPITFDIRVVDESGANMIDPEHPRSITKTDIKVEMDGKMYQLEDLLSKGRPLRALPANFYGFYYHKVYYNNMWLLEFGEFDGGYDLDKTIVVHWADGSKNSLRITNERSWSQSLGYHARKRTLFLDGKQLSYGARYFRFVK